MSQFEPFFERVETIFFEVLKELPIPEEEIKTAGFWMFYCDNVNLGTPCFAYNSKDLSSSLGKWSPPNWSVNIEKTIMNSLRPIYEEIIAYMEGKNFQHWMELVQYQLKFYSKLCQKINAPHDSEDHPLREWNLGADFVCGIFDEREGPTEFSKYVEMSVGEEKAKQLGII